MYAQIFSVFSFLDYFGVNHGVYGLGGYGTDVGQIWNKAKYDQTQEKRCFYWL